MITLHLADQRDLAAAQYAVAAHHYLRAPVDSRCSPVAYLVVAADEHVVGCLIFGRPKATRCYQGGLTYGSLSDVRAGKAYWLLDVRPALAIDDVKHSSVPQPKLTCDCKAAFALRRQSTNLSHLSFCKARECILFALALLRVVSKVALHSLSNLLISGGKSFGFGASVSPLTMAIGIVLLHSPYPEMPWVAAQGIVAGVAHNPGTVQRLARCEFVGESMRRCFDAPTSAWVVEAVNSIQAFLVAADPQPAGVITTRAVKHLPEVGGNVRVLIKHLGLLLWSVRWLAIVFVASDFRLFDQVVATLLRSSDEPSLDESNNRPGFDAQSVRHLCSGEHLGVLPFNDGTVCFCPSLVAEPSISIAHFNQSQSGLKQSLGVLLEIFKCAVIVGWLRVCLAAVVGGLVHHCGSPWLLVRTKNSIPWYTVNASKHLVKFANLARVWLDPRVQAGGRWCTPKNLPGYTDRRGVWRSTLASWCIQAALERVGSDYLTVRPPVFPDEPYEIKAVLSYCDTRLHRGTIYRAAGFDLARTNERGIETWYTPKVAPLTNYQHDQIRKLAYHSPRGIRLRAQRQTAQMEMGV